MLSITVICKIDNTKYKLRNNSTCIGIELERTNTKPPKWQCLLSNILMHCLITPSPYFQQTLMIINYKMIFCYIYIKEAKLMNKNQSETSLIINLLHKKCFIHQLLKHNIINTNNKEYWQNKTERYMYKRSNCVLTSCIELLLKTTNYIRCNSNCCSKLSFVLF